MFLNNTHPFECCHYPLADTKKTAADHCYRECFENPEKCCVVDCLYDEMKWYNNGMYSLEQRIKFYEAEIDNKKIPGDKWMPIVKESVKKCEEKSNLKNL
jgi:hypothetical protein